ncbi:hypothetical protein [uncultured Tateyamaria sp.]|uniref:hypothetical protein n=1 Tax=uncultured Tateyamaria sp. TaxID=455651 RepID=UPI002616826C|nr:hypothetical protein [uncultured Tateyamaria sp.]
MITDPQTGTSFRSGDNAERYRDLKEPASSRLYRNGQPAIGIGFSNMLGRTIVGIQAFSPVGCSPDNTGEYAGSLFWTIDIALLFSWRVAIWLVPYYCTLLLEAGNADGEEKGNRRPERLSGLRALAIRVR